MAMDGLDREHVYELFERAVKDYICECLALGLSCPVLCWEVLPGKDALVPNLESCFFCGVQLFSRDCLGLRLK